MPTKGKRKTSTGPRQRTAGTTVPKGKRVRVGGTYYKHLGGGNYEGTPASSRMKKTKKAPRYNTKKGKVTGRKMGRKTRR